MAMNYGLFYLLDGHLARLRDEEDGEQDGDDADASEEEEHCSGRKRGAQVWQEV
jgi:hypothetical protein